MLPSCNQSKLWTEDEIRNIAEDVATEPQDLSAIERRLAEAEARNDRLQNLVEAQGRVIDAQSRQIDALNDSVLAIENRLRR